MKKSNAFVSSLTALGLLVPLAFLAIVPIVPASAHTCDGSTTAVGNPNITCVYSGFMTGGGKFNANVNTAPAPATSQEILVHGFILHCNASVSPNNLEVNWKDSSGVEHHFHLEDLQAAHCEMNPALGSPNPPKANFNTWVGSGTGSLDGQPGAFVYAIFSDQSQPAGTQAGGQGDWSTIVIYSPSGSLALDVTSTLFGGAQQAHMCHGNC